MLISICIPDGFYNSIWFYFFYYKYPLWTTVNTLPQIKGLFCCENPVLNDKFKDLWNTKIDQIQILYNELSNTYLRLKIPPKNDFLKSVNCIHQTKCESKIKFIFTPCCTKPRFKGSRLGPRSYEPNTYFIALFITIPKLSLLFLLVME